MKSIAEILRPEALDLPELPRVEVIDWVRGEDHIGDMSLFIDVVLADDTPKKLRHSTHYAPVGEAILLALQAEGHDEFPYCTYLLRAEWDKRSPKRDPAPNRARAGTAIRPTAGETASPVRSAQGDGESDGYRRPMMKSIGEILKPEALDLPDKPRVERIEWVRAPDHIGDMCVFILVVMPDDTPDEWRHLPYLRPMRDRMRAALRQEGHEEFAHFEFLTQSEVAEDRAAA